jgi:hypothetical protein
MSNISDRVIEMISFKNKGEITKIVRVMSESHSRLNGVLEVNELSNELTAEMEMGGRNEPSNQQRGEDMQYLLDLIEAYTKAEPTAEGRRHRIGTFAENYQMHPSEVEKVLKYLELEI